MFNRSQFLPVTILSMMMWEAVLLAMIISKDSTPQSNIMQRLAMKSYYMQPLCNASILLHIQNKNTFAWMMNHTFNFVVWATTFIAARILQLIKSYIYLYDTVKRCDHYSCCSKQNVHALYVCEQSLASVHWLRCLILVWLCILTASLMGCVELQFFPFTININTPTFDHCRRASWLTLMISSFTE